jgi:hypothetical protein
MSFASGIYWIIPGQGKSGQFILRRFFVCRPLFSSLAISGNKITRHATRPGSDCVADTCRPRNCLFGKEQRYGPLDQSCSRAAARVSCEPLTDVSGVMAVFCQVSTFADVFADSGPFPARKSSIC